MLKLVLKTLSDRLPRRHFADASYPCSEIPSLLTPLNHVKRKRFILHKDLRDVHNDSRDAANFRAVYSGMLLVFVIGLAALLAVGVALAWIVSGSRSGRSETRLRAEQLSQELTQRTAALDAAQAALAAQSQQITDLKTENARLEERLVAEKTAMEQARASLSETFSSLAARALANNNESFLTFAKLELEKQQQGANRTLESKEKAIETLLKPVGEALDKLQKETHELEVKREGAYGTVLTEIKNIQETHQGLRRETTQLIQALRAPKARGNWGELQLKRCIEFAGMVEHASFDVEVFVRGDEASIRPDCVIRLPNERTIVIDVKTPFDAFLDAMSTTDEATRSLKLIAHAARVRAHLGQLSAKAYWKQFKDSPDFVVCFLSSEVLFSAALEQDPGLIEFGSNSNVMLATPTTLIALLKAVAYGWQQMEITRNAIAIREASEKLYEKLATAHDYFSSMGKALANAVKHYNNLVGGIEGRGSVFSLARKLHDFGIGQDELPEAPLLESVTRELKGDDWSSSPPGGLQLAASADEGRPEAGK
jgi:DNA recombination protein RmuC